MVEQLVVEQHAHHTNNDQDKGAPVVAVIQIVLDNGGNVVGINKVPVAGLTKAFNSASGAYSYGTTSGTYKLAVDSGYGHLIEQSTVLTDQEKVAARVAVSGREVGDTVQFVGVGGQSGEVIVAASALNQVIQQGIADGAAKPKSLVAVFIDP